MDDNDLTSSDCRPVVNGRALPLGRHVGPMNGGIALPQKTEQKKRPRYKNRSVRFSAQMRKIP